MEKHCVKTLNSSATKMLCMLRVADEEAMEGKKRYYFTYGDAIELLSAYWPEMPAAEASGAFYALENEGMIEKVGCACDEGIDDIKPLYLVSEDGRGYVVWIRDGKAKAASGGQNAEEKAAK